MCERCCQLVAIHVVHKYTYARILHVVLVVGAFEICSSLFFVLHCLVFRCSWQLTPFTLPGFLCFSECKNCFAYLVPLPPKHKYTHTCAEICGDMQGCGEIRRYTETETQVVELHRDMQRYTELHRDTQRYATTHGDTRRYKQ